MAENIRPKTRVLSLAGLPQLKNQANDINLKVLTFVDTVFHIEPGRVQLVLPKSSLRDYSFVWLHSGWATRDIAYSIALLLKYLNIPHNKVERDFSKLTDYVAMALKEVSIPKTYFSRNQKLYQRYDDVVEYLGSPFVLKPCRSTWGKGIHLVKTKRQFRSIVSKLNKSRPYVCQEYIHNKFDYRIVVSFGKVVSCEKRIRKPGFVEFRNNAHLGAKEVFFEPCDLPKEIEHLALASADALNLDWCGVDIVPDMKEEKFYTIEVNRNPGTTAGSTEVPAALTHLRKTIGKHS